MPDILFILSHRLPKKVAYVVLFIYFFLTSFNPHKIKNLGVFPALSAFSSKLSLVFPRLSYHVLPKTSTVI